MMVDGVEITSPQSTDNIFFGPISSFEVLNGGDGYDILNPPNITISAGAGSTAYVEPVVQGIVKSVLVDPQDFDVDEVLSVTLTGMNGEGCELKPIMGEDSVRLNLIHVNYLLVVELILMMKLLHSENHTI